MKVAPLARRITSWSICVQRKERERETHEKKANLPERKTSNLPVRRKVRLGRIEPDMATMLASVFSREEWRAEWRHRSGDRKGVRTSFR